MQYISELRSKIYVEVRKEGEGAYVELSVADFIPVFVPFTTSVLIA